MEDGIERWKVCRRLWWAKVGLMKAVSRSGEFIAAETASSIANAVPFGSGCEHASKRNINTTYEKFEATKAQLDGHKGKVYGMLGPFHV
jgi:hypothetical protein